MSLTTVGANRERYAELMQGVDPRPTMFIKSRGNVAYNRERAAWNERADIWAKRTTAEHMTTCKGCQDPINYPHTFDCTGG